MIINEIKIHLVIILFFLVFTIIAILSNSDSMGSFLGSIAGVSIDPALIIMAVLAGFFERKYMKFIAVSLFFFILFSVWDFLNLTISFSNYIQVIPYKLIGFVIFAHMANMINILRQSKK